MQGLDQTANISISIKYRITLVIVCTLVYLFSLVNSGSGVWRKHLIALGMLVSCFLAIYLYRKILSQIELRKWIKGVLAMEMFAYGIFTFLSGGFSSPYFLYYIGCLFVMMAVQFSMISIILGMLWCLICSVASRLIALRDMVNLELNLAIGGIIMIGTFYILLCYLNRVLKYQELQKELNLRLQQEKERSEQALQHVTDLYDTFNLFAMTDPYKVMEELCSILWRTIAPEGCILVKLSLDGTVEKQAFCGMEESWVSCVIDAALKQRESDAEDGSGPVWLEIAFPVEQVRFESMRIGKLSPRQGVLIRKRAVGGGVASKQDRVYCGLVEIIFRNLDIQKQLEEYITTEEQHRLAGEIHDTVIQKLFGIACSMKLLEANLENQDQDEVVIKIQALKRSVELIMKELREAIYGRDFNGGEDAFRKKLKDYMEEVERISGVDIRLQLDEKLDMITTAQKVAIYRIACEAVNNAVRHGRAKSVSVDVRLEQGVIWAEIIDNGTGCIDFPAAAPLHGKGVKNMHRMVSLLRGQFEMESGKKRGTIVRFNLPL